MNATHTQPVIMHVEDDPAHARLVAEVVHGMDAVGDYLQFESAESALQYLRRASVGTDDPLPNVILMDNRLPGISGLEAIGLLKADHKTRGIPIVILTSTYDPKLIDHAFSMGAASYLVKDLDYNSFVVKLAEAVQYWVMTTETPKPVGTIE